ncbi:hypothetical protein LRS73_32590 (plasmid) [Methylobacterium currus]|uniref:hypothetical protein n=1 Tax=Methylobacterium currus TaxID=2051553 RepID=UPI001E64D0AB|nr:hypothetical protein [Methylobacterium currus]UHC20100.1 hypothetical protein LRS73_32590 [Methylobacterium currus]
MPLTTVCRTLNAEISAAEHRATAQARSVKGLLAAGEINGSAEQALYLELDRLALLRTQLWAIEEMRSRPRAA